MAALAGGEHHSFKVAVASSSLAGSTMRSVWDLLFALAIVPVMTDVEFSFTNNIAAHYAEREYRTVDLAHWLPNMPRGSERI